MSTVRRNNCIYLIGPDRESSPKRRIQFEEVCALLNNLKVALHAPIGSQRMEATVWGITEEIRKEFARDIDVLLSCNAVALLPDWSSSRGAVAEYTLAKAAGLPVFSIDVA